MQKQGVLEEKPLLIVIDAHALVHRAFHALPPFSVRRTGEPTGAVFGFVNTLLKSLNELNPTHWAIAFDRPGPTFRHTRYEGYKATRPKASVELISQFRRVHDLVQAFNMPVFELDGYEADDVIGTLCLQAEQKGMDTIIITGDTDTVQLVSPRVRSLIPKGMFRDTVLYDEAAVKERYGVTPSQIADFKSLKGDPTDNIPGVPSIGDKTAAKLLQQFESIEELYRRINEVEPPKLRDLLRQNEEMVRRNKELATILRDLPITLDLSACRRSAYNREKVLELFRELEFTSILARLPQSEGLSLETGKPPAKTEVIAPETSYVTIDTPEALDKLVDELSKAGQIVFDVETTSLDPMNAALVGISFSTASGRASYIPVGHRSGTQLSLQLVFERLKPIIENPQIPKLAHNGKYDTAVLGNHRLGVQGLAFDTMLAGYLLGEKALGLKDLAFRRLGVVMTPITELIGTGKKQLSMAEVDIPRVSSYACADADMTGRLAGLFGEELKKQDLWKLFSEVEIPLVPVLVQMERNGVALDTALLSRMSLEMGEELAKLEAQIYNLVGHRFNINSPQQLGAVLFGELRLPKARRTKSGYSTDAAVLDALKGVHPVVELILQYRQLAKLKSTYIDALPALVNPVTRRVHTSLNQTVTSTGRLSSSDPNLQNIPVRTELGGQVRQAFVAEGAPDWLLLSADYSQIDLRVLAHLSQDTALIEAFHRGEDIHASTASHVFGVPMENVTPDMRRLAKVVNFGIIYGMSDYGLSQRTELSQEEASTFINNYFQKYPRVREYMESTKRLAQERGYVQTLLGRRRYIPEINSSNAQARQAAERMAINMPVQGTSADIIKVAMVRIHRAMQEQCIKSKMILQVHDELIFEVPKGELADMKALAQDAMSRAVELSVPLKVDLKVGTTWGEME
ncbi:MAG: DNA polymerase I [Chloroflexi bacterium]|nr:DNA polymerase I [Chloroflexota bacterium]